MSARLNSEGGKTVSHKEHGLEITEYVSGTANTGLGEATPGDKTSAKTQHIDASLQAPTTERGRTLSAESARFHVLGGIQSPSRSRSPLYPPPQASVKNGTNKSIQERARNSLFSFWARNKGLVMVLIAQFFNVLMNVSARVLQKEGNHGKGLHPLQVLFARMGITWILSTLYMWWHKTEHFPLGLKEVRGLLCLRSFGGFFGVFGMYYSLLYLPLSDATVITFLAPSLACWACSFLINEPFTRIEQIGACMSILGVVLIARPTSLFVGTSPSTTLPASGIADGTTVTSNSTDIPIVDPSHYAAVTPSQRAGAVGVALLGVLGAACAYTTIRWIGKRAHPLISVNYYAAWVTIVCFIAMAAFPSIGFVLPATLREWGLLTFLGVCGFTMQFLLAAGLQAEKSSRATNMVYTQMLFALGFDKVIFGSSPSVMSIVGSSLILGSAIYVAVRKEKTKEQKGQEVVRDEERGLMDGIDDGNGENERDVQLRSFRT